MKHECMIENAWKFIDWIENRGGIAIWKSANLSNPGASWSTPALTEDGHSYPRPTWEAQSHPRIISNMEDVEVYSHKEVKRIYVAVRRASNSFALKLTDGSSRKVRNAVTKVGKGAFYRFDYGTQEAVIYSVKFEGTLAEWKKKNAE